MKRMDHAMLFASALSALVAGAGCSSSATNPSTLAVAPSRTSVDGKFARYLVTPAGDVDGAVLEDGTVARFPPHAFETNAAKLSPGDAVHVEGDVTAASAPSASSARVLTRASLAKGTSVIARADSEPPPPPPGGPGGRGLRGPKRPDPMRDAALAPMTVTGKIASFSSDPRGRVDGFYLTDGTSARAGRKARVEALGLKAGDTITVTGRGGSYPQGRSLTVETIKLPSGEVRTLARPVAELSSVTVEGEVARVLINPHGDLDGLLLKNGSVVRVPPGSVKVAVGATVQAVGQGTASFVHADTLTLRATASAPAQTVTLATAPPAPPAAPPAPLATVTTSATIDAIVRGPDGDTDAIVLSDGALVSLPPGLRDDAGDALRVGQKVSVRGEGGVYGAATSLRATHLELMNGQAFDDAPPPRPAAPPAPTPAGQ